MINIHHCRDFSDVRYSDRDYNVYTPKFRRHDNGEHNDLIIMNQNLICITMHGETENLTKNIQGKKAGEIKITAL